MDVCMMLLGRCFANTSRAATRFPKKYPLMPVRELQGVEVQWTLGAMLYLNRFQPLSRIQRCAHG
jgi:hypothetical protein